MPAPPGRPAGSATDPLLDIRGLVTEFTTESGRIRAVAGVDLRIDAGQTVALVGESGSGKSVTSLSVMRLIRAPRGRIAAGVIRFRCRDGVVRDLATLDEAAMSAIRGNEISMIFQEPMTSLNPAHSVGHQIAEAVRLHRKVPRGSLAARGGDAVPGGDTGSAAAGRELSASAFGRHAPARDDRHGACLPAGASHRR